MRIHVCNQSELPPGHARRVRVDGRDPIALYNVGGAFFATDDLCTHGFSSLAEDGTIVGDEIECGWHGGRFRIATGEPTATPCTSPLRVYRVELAGEDLYLVLC